MTKKTISNQPTLLEQIEEKWPLIVWIIFLFTFCFRLMNLSDIPVSGTESGLAMTAAKISQGKAGLSTDLPVYTGITAVLFFVFGTETIWSRILPILVGSSLVFIPGLWKDKLNPVTVLVLSLAFSLMPTVTFFSRAIHSGIFAIVSLSWLATLIHMRRWELAGVAGAFIWLSGNLALPLSLMALVSLMIVKRISNSGESALQTKQIHKAEWFRFLASLSGTAILISTSFFLNPVGLGNIGSYFTAATANLSVWRPEGITRAAYLLLQYAFFPLILFVASFIKLIHHRSTNRPENLYLALFSMLCLIFSIGNPNYLLPFSIITCFFAATLWEVDRVPMKIQKVVYLPLVIFGIALLVYTAIVSKAWASATATIGGLGLAVIAGIFLFILAHVFVGLGWSSRIAISAASTSLLIILIAGSLSATFRLVLAEPGLSALHWQQTELFEDTEIMPLLVEFQNSGKFEAGELKFYADTALQPSSGWILRSLTHLNDLSAQEIPQVAITTSATGVPYETGYRGTSISCAKQVDWSLVRSNQFAGGILGLGLPTTDQPCYLWVVNSFFSGN